jgi:LmbE family N-acetylglucosaminyl deacetylase
MTGSAAAACSLLFLALGCAAPKVERQAKTLLAVFAHPDDEAFVGPLLSHYARQGVRVHLAIVTDGAKGGSPRTGIPAGPETASVRAEEARCSCRELGIEPPTLLGFEDDGLGKANDPPAGYLAEVVRAVRKLLAQVRPDAVVTWGPDGGYGHPDHRLVSAVVTQAVQASVQGAPSRLLYAGLPKDRVRRRPGDPRWALTDARFLTVRVPYDAADLEATRRAFACHRSQFSAEQGEVLVSWLHETLGGRVYLRPWFGAPATDDVFDLGLP